jgi:hypothetical protein
MSEQAADFADARCVIGTPLLAIQTIPVLESYRFGLSQCLLGATIFVKTLRSPHNFLMHGGQPCMLRI